MSQTDEELLAKKLSALFPNQSWWLSEPWEQSAWSKSYKLEFETQSALYIKATPRSRAEARTTSFLHSLYPEHIAEVRVEDLLPQHEWRYFLLEDVGDCNHTAITPECAIQAALSLGRLQHIVSQHPHLAAYLPQCRADSLQVAAMSVIDWALRTASAERHLELLSFRTQVGAATTYFRALREDLACLPPTCIHGDLWSGNIACRNGTVSFIDWGDALWGVGSVSIVNLLATADGALSGDADEIWAAYARGWERDLTERFIRASQAAWLVSNLVVDVEIARCCDGDVEMLPGLIPGLQRLTRLCE